MEAELCRCVGGRGVLIMRDGFGEVFRCHLEGVLGGTGIEFLFFTFSFVLYFIPVCKFFREAYLRKVFGLRGEDSFNLFGPVCLC